MFALRSLAYFPDQTSNDATNKVNYRGNNEDVSEIAKTNVCWMFHYNTLLLDNTETT